MPKELGGYDGVNCIRENLLKEMFIRADRAGKSAHDCNMPALWPMEFNVELHGKKYLLKRNRLSEKYISISSEDSRPVTEWARDILAVKPEYFSARQSLDVRLDGSFETEDRSETGSFSLYLRYFGRIGLGADMDGQGNPILRFSRPGEHPGFPYNAARNSMGTILHGGFKVFIPGDVVRERGHASQFFDGPPVYFNETRIVHDANGNAYRFATQNGDRILLDSNGVEIAKVYNDMHVPALDFACIAAADWNGRRLSEQESDGLANSISFQRNTTKKEELSIFSVRLPVDTLPMVDPDMIHQVIINNLNSEVNPEVLPGVRLRDILAWSLSVNPDIIQNLIPAPPTSEFMDFDFRFIKEREQLLAGVRMGMVSYRSIPVFLSGERTRPVAPNIMNVDIDFTRADGWEPPSDQNITMVSGLSSGLLIDAFRGFLTLQLSQLRNIADVIVRDASLLGDEPIRFRDGFVEFDFQGNGTRAVEFLFWDIAEMNFTFTVRNIRLVADNINSVKHIVNDDGSVTYLDMYGNPIPAGIVQPDNDSVLESSPGANRICFYAYCDPALGRWPVLPSGFAMSALPTGEVADPEGFTAEDMTTNRQLQHIQDFIVRIDSEQATTEVTLDTASRWIVAGLIIAAVISAALALLTAGITTGLAGAAAAAVGSIGAIFLIITIGLSVGLARAAGGINSSGMGASRFRQLVEKRALVPKTDAALAWTEVYPRFVDFWGTGLVFLSRAFSLNNLLGELFHRPRLPDCFVATAVYGKTSWKIDVLRGFRDDYLLKKPWGRSVTNLYYSYGSNLASFVLKHKSLKKPLQKIFDMLVQYLIRSKK